MISMFAPESGMKILSITNCKSMQWYQHVSPFKEHGSVMDIGAENGIGEPSSNSGLVYCVHIRTNVSWKGMNLSLLHPQV